MDKRLSAAFLAVLLLLSLAGCKQSSSEPAEEPAHTTQKKPADDTVPQTVKGENGLEYQWADDLKGYALSGMGDCKESILTVPEKIGGYPVVAVGVDAFADSHQLKEITLPDSVITIGGGAFRGCIYLENIRLGQFVESIDRYAFQDCMSLDHFTMPPGVMSMGMGAFSGCSSLESIAFSDYIPEISRAAFENCSSLVTLSIPQWATYIAADAFAGCTSLVGLTVPEWVKKIDSGAFSGCTSLKKVVFEGQDGWTVTMKDSTEELIPDLSNSQANVNYLTVEYANAVWMKK